MSFQQISIGIVALSGFAAALFAPRFGDGLFTTVETLALRLAEKKHVAIVAIGVSAIVLRLSLIWFVPVPVPEVADEFSYLLAGDTFSHGRLTNPAHPMWLYFDTFLEIQHPTYMSKFHPAQGAALALGQMLGHPWIGVLLSMAAMCAACLWALQAWLPPGWALLGGILVLLRFAIFGYWINSYWGGGVAAIGGALVIGALPRITHYNWARYSAILGIGAVVLFNTRPFEGFIFCLPVFGALLLWIFRRQRFYWRLVLFRIIFPLCVVGTLCAAFDGYYNWRGTGDPFIFPYVLHERTYNSLPPFQWQIATAPHHYVNPQFAGIYNGDGWARINWKKGRITNLKSLIFVSGTDAKHLVAFFLWPELFFVLVAASPWIVRDQRVRPLLIQGGVCLAGYLLVVWFQYHYVAPLTATIICLVVQAIRHLRKWQVGSRQVGIGLSRATVLLAVVLAPFHPLYTNLLPAMAAREVIERKLSHLPGEHLVIVRYSPRHNPHEEWVYNRADIDHAKIVWGREIPGLSPDPLLAYFRGRQVWIVEPDESTLKLLPYSGGTGKAQMTLEGSSDSGSKLRPAVGADSPSNDDRSHGRNPLVIHESTVRHLAK